MSENVESRAEAIERFRKANDKKSFAKKMVDETNAGLKMNKPPEGQFPGSSVIDNEGVATPQNINQEDMDFFTAIKSGNAARAQELLDKGEFISGVMPEALEADMHRSSANRSVGLGESSQFTNAAKSLEDPRQAVDIDKIGADTARADLLAQENVDAGKAKRSNDKAVIAENRRLNDSRIEQIDQNIKVQTSEQIRANANEIAVAAQEVIDREIAIYNQAKASGDTVSMRKAIKSMKDVNRLMKNNSIIIQKNIDKYLVDRLD